MALWHYSISAHQHQLRISSSTPAPAPAPAPHQHQYISTSSSAEHAMEYNKSNFNHRAMNLMALEECSK